jgi:DNA-binding CsgD family transcriptional regulator
MSVITFFSIFNIFLCFASGFTSIFICIILYSKYHLVEIKNYLYFLLVITFIVLIITINFYYKSIFTYYGNNKYNFFFFNSLLIGSCLYIYTLPVFIYSLIEKFLIKKRFLLLISFIPIIFYIIIGVFNLIYKFKINVIKISLYFTEIILIFIIFHVFCYILYHLKDVKNSLRKKALILVLLFIILYSPFAIIDSFYDKFHNLIFKYFPDGFSFSLPFYFLWNILTLILTGRYFIKINFNIGNEFLEETIKKYKITNREREILLYIIKGHSNQEISDKAFISITTVKKHIYNLFLKTGAKNRIELINILKY